MSYEPKPELQQAYDEWHMAVQRSSDIQSTSLAHCLRDWHFNALQLAPAVSGLKVLEVGCGAGDFALYLASQGAQVTAVDFSDAAIELAKDKFAKTNYQVNFLVADAQNLLLEDNSFDLVFSCECLEHVASPHLMLRECSRVLRPQGQLILTTENYANAMILGWIVCWLRKQPFNSGEKVQPIDHFFVFWNVAAMMQKAGLQVKHMLGSHHVFLLLPRFHPHTFVVERFANKFFAAFFRPLARHMAFLAVKQD